MDQNIVEVQHNQEKEQKEAKEEVEDYKKKEEEEEMNFYTTEENYYHHAHVQCPEALQRGDITYTSRLLGYADAVMATAATFLVIPLRNLKHMEHGESFLHRFSKSDDLFMFNFGLMLVLIIWGHINRENVVFRQADGFFVMATMLIMLLTSLLPLSLKLMSHFRLHHQSFDNQVFFFCGTLICIYIVECMKILYAFWNRKLLHFFVQKYADKELVCIRNYLFIKPLFNIMYCLVTIFWALVGYSSLVWIFVGTTLLIPFLHRGIYFLHLRVSANSFYAANSVLIRFREGNIDKERVETLTDAAVAIIALVLVIDITAEEDFHIVAEKMAKDGIGYTIVHNRHILKFLACYVLTSIHWYLNHIVLHFFHRCDVVTCALQMGFLLSLCYFPLLTEMLLRKCWCMTSKDIRFAVGLTAGIIFGCSLMNLLMFLRGLHLKDKALHKWLLSTEYMTDNIRKNIYVILKLCCVPVCALILGLSVIATSTDHLSIMLWVCFFLPVIMLAAIKLLSSKNKISVAPEDPDLFPSSTASPTTVISPIFENKLANDPDGQTLPQQQVHNINTPQ